MLASSILVLMLVNDRNIMCEDGLVNGACGEIVGFKWSGSADHQDQPGMLPAAVLVKFHDPHAIMWAEFTPYQYLDVIVKQLKSNLYQPNSLLNKV